MKTQFAAYFCHIQSFIAWTEQHSHKYKSCMVRKKNADGSLWVYLERK